MVQKALQIYCVLVLLLSVIMWFPEPGYSQQFHGQLSGWGNIQTDEDMDAWGSIGARYLPDFVYNFTPQRPYIIDSEISANLYVNYNSDIEETFSDAKPYRLWIRYATHKFESRIGLQKINFGPAKLLRSEMWFDRLDPRDPLQFTEGVYALRIRYDFENLSSIWLWGIYGESDTKGLEIVPSKKGSLELGGRIQYPVGPGEMALSYHYRQLSEKYFGSLAGEEPSTAENRIALDGIWDIGVGAWFETAIVHADYIDETYRWQSFQTVGMDYTVPWGNGLHVLAEHMIVTVSNRVFDFAEDTQTTGLMASYPIGWLDQIALYSIYNWGMEMAYHYFSWQRTYDNWVLHASLFGRTGDSALLELHQTMTTVGKFGIQLMVVFNH